MIELAAMVEPGNVLQEALAIEFLSELDGMIQADIMLMGPEEIVSYDNAEQELLLRPPHDKIYVHYLVAMIRQVQQEFEGYNNAQAAVNEKLSAFETWYSAHYQPAVSMSREYLGAAPGGPGYGFVYLTAYGLAVKRGYRGTEEDWLKSLKGDTGDPARMRFDAGREMIQWGVEGQWYDLFALDEIVDPAAAAIIDRAEAAANDAAAYAAQAELAKNNAESERRAAGISAEDAASWSAAASGSMSSAWEAASNANASSGSAAQSAGEAQLAAGRAGSAAVQAEGAAADSAGAADAASASAGRAQAAAEAAEESVNNALARAKASGEFDGQRGNGILRVTTEPNSYIVAIGGAVSIKRMPLETVRAEAGVDEVLVGDQIAHSHYLYHVYHVDGTWVYMDTYVSVRGAQGEPGMAPPLVLDAQTDYTADASKGDEALEAIIRNRQILVRVPNADGGEYTAIYSPVMMHQLPNRENNYLYLFYLRDEKQDLTNVVGYPIQMPTYGELKMLLSKTYNESPLANPQEHLKDTQVYLKGDPGRGIRSITQTGGSGAAGTVDEYTITYTDGTTDTYQIRNGTDGTDGITPHIGANGNWFIGDTDTGVNTEGVQYTAQTPTPEQQATARGNIGAAEGIVLEASGEVIALNDSSDQRIRGLKIYGKTMQDGTPSTEAPVELVSAGTSGSIGVTMTAKNLFDYTEHKANVNHSIIPVVGGKTLYRNGKIGTSANWRIYDNADQLLGTFAGLGFTASNPLVLPANASYIESTDSSISLSELYIGYDSDTTFVPYKGQNLAVQTPDGLHGRRVSSGGNYTDASGQQWLCDVIDMEWSVRTQRLRKRTLTGADNWFRSTNTNYFAINIADKLPASPIMCSRFTHASSLGSTAPGWWSDNPANNLFAITGYADMSMDEFKTHLNENPIDIIFTLATPIETPLSAEEIAAFRALHTNKPNTTVYNDAGAYMAVEYVADTKLYIDNKFAELAAALVRNS